MESTAILNKTKKSFDILECLINGKSVKPGYSKIGDVWYDCNDAGLKEIGAGKCDKHELEEIWEDGSFKKRCTYQNGRLEEIEVFCVHEGKQVAPTEVVITNENAKAGLICKRQKNRSLKLEIATESEFNSWTTR